MADGTLVDPQFGTVPPRLTEMKRGNVSQPEDRHVTRAPRDLPFLMDGDFLKVRNRDRKTWDFRWAKKHYTIAPDAEGFVPFEALVNSLGDPRSQDNALTKFSDGDGNKGIVMDRHAEITRLFAIYAIENEDMDKLVEAAPHVEVETLTGQRINFPVQRPDMLPYPVTLIDDHAVNSDTTRMIDQVAAENAELRTRMEELETRLHQEISAREGVTEGV